MKDVVPVERITSKIYLIRGQKVMLDRDLAELYGVGTKVLKQAVRRNSKRFSEDFMFELSGEEFKNWRSQFVTGGEFAIQRFDLRLRNPPDHHVLIDGGANIPVGKSFGFPWRKIPRSTPS